MLLHRFTACCHCHSPSCSDAAGHKTTPPPLRHIHCEQIASLIDRRLIILTSLIAGGVFRLVYSSKHNSSSENLGVFHLTNRNRNRFLIYLIPFEKPNPVWIKPCEPISRRLLHETKTVEFRRLMNTCHHHHHVRLIQVVKLNHRNHRLLYNPVNIVLSVFLRIKHY